jgi:hypothetical protein
VFFATIRNFVATSLGAPQRFTTTTMIGRHLKKRGPRTKEKIALGVLSSQQLANTLANMFFCLNVSQLLLLLSRLSCCLKKQKGGEKKTN